VAAAFRAQVCKPLPATVVCNPAPRRRSKLPATDDGMPRRSVRVVAQGKNRVTNPEQQARNVLLHKLNIISEKQLPDTEAIKTYDSIFRSLLGSVQRRAVRALFTAHCPAPSVMASDMEP
jgi:hypothetical protein